MYMMIYLLCRYQPQNSLFWQLYQRERFESHLNIGSEHKSCARTVTRLLLCDMPKIVNSTS